MLKFTLNSKELKTIIEKGKTVVNKKSSFSAFKRLYLQVTEDGILKVFGTDGEHYLEIVNHNAENTFAGIVGVDIEDLKLISKMNGEVTLTDISTENEKKFNINCGKKNIKFINYNYENISLLDMSSEEIQIMRLTESWLFETVVYLSVYTSDNETREIFQTMNFNTKDRRVETTDSFRIGMRELKENQIIKSDEGIMLHKRCLPVFKKILDKKSNDKVIVSQDSKHIKIYGKDFTYITKKICGDFFDVSKILSDDKNYSFIADKENMLEIMEYNFELSKLSENSEPVIFHCKNGELYTYVRTEKYENLDSINAENITMNDMYIGFNPKYITDVMKIIDNDKPLFRGKNNKSPMFIEGNEYKFLILPIFLTSTEKYIEDIEKMKEYINKIKES